MSILLITHDLGVVAEMCDDVVVMYAGRVVERGPVDEVFSSPQHPYTEALLQSIPMLGMTQARAAAGDPRHGAEPARLAARAAASRRAATTPSSSCAEQPPLFEVDAQALGVLALRARAPRDDRRRGVEA